MEEASFLIARAPVNPELKPNVNPRSLYNNSYSVFLRIRPNTNSKNYLQKKNDDTLVVLGVKDTAKSTSFRYTKILGEDSSQLEMYQTSFIPIVKSFLENEEHGVIMAYGTTSAGKTYTMCGNSECPGIVPRALTTLYHKYGSYLAPNDSHFSRLQPYRGTRLLELDDKQFSSMESFKKFILSQDLSKYQRSVNNSSFIKLRSNAEELLRGSENISFALKENESVSVWISMFEIYNDNVLDLLTYRSTSEENKRRTLSIGMDDDGNFFAKNATQILANSTEEALQVYQFGCLNLQTASTLLNDRSSRSHCVLQVTVVKHVGDKLKNTMSKISFVDLAGSERGKKTGSDAERLKEAAWINKSLVTLGQCLNTLKENQMTSIRKIVPIRDSILTKLFKSALLGSERLTFIINVSTNPALYDETMNVLRFSALAREVVPEKKVETSRLIRRYSRLVASSEEIVRLVEDDENTVSDSINISYAERIRDLEEMVANLELERQHLKKESDERALKLYAQHKKFQEFHESSYREKLKEWEEKYEKLSAKYDRLADKALSYKIRMRDSERKIEELSETLEEEKQLRTEMQEKFEAAVSDWRKKEEEMGEELNDLRSKVKEHDFKLKINSLPIARSPFRNCTNISSAAVQLSNDPIVIELPMVPNPMLEDEILMSKVGRNVRRSLCEPAEQEAKVESKKTTRRARTTTKVRDHPAITRSLRTRRNAAVPDDENAEPDCNKTDKSKARKKLFNVDNDSFF